MSDDTQPLLHTETCPHELRNVILNGAGVMLVYAANFGWSAIMPTALRDLEQPGGPSENDAYIGLLILNVCVVLTGPIAPLCAKRFGVVLTLIIAGILTGVPQLCMVYPTVISVYIGCGVNGIGCMLLRTTSLTFLAESSSVKNLSRNNGIYWMLFWSSALLGNFLVMGINWGVMIITLRHRIIISACLLSVCYSSLLCFILLRKPQFNSCKNILNDEELASSLTSTSCKSIPRISEFAAFVNIKTFLLLIVFLATGVFMASFSAFFPTEVGKILPVMYVSMFGMIVGVGQMWGALCAGWILKHLTVNTMTAVTMLLGLLTMFFSGFVLDLEVPFIISPILTPRLLFVSIIAFCLGVLNSGNSVTVSTIIGLKYPGHRSRAYSIYIIVCSLSMMLFNYLITVLPVLYMLCLFSALLLGSLVSAVIMIMCNY